MMDLSDHRILPLDRMAGQDGSELRQAREPNQEIQALRPSPRSASRVCACPGRGLRHRRISSTSPNSGRNKRRQAHHAGTEITANPEDKKNHTEADCRVCHALPIIRLLFWTRAASLYHWLAFDLLICKPPSRSAFRVRPPNPGGTLPVVPQRIESKRESCRSEAMQSLLTGGASGPAIKPGQTRCVSVAPKHHRIQAADAEGRRAAHCRADRNHPPVDRAGRADDSTGATAEADLVVAAAA